MVFLSKRLSLEAQPQQAGLQGGGLSVTISGMEFLLGGDIITNINGQALNNAEEFTKMIQSIKVGDKISLTFYREKKTRKV